MKKMGISEVVMWRLSKYVEDMEEGQTNLTV